MRTEQKWEKLVSNRTDSSVSVDERQIKESRGGRQRSLPLPYLSRKIKGPLLAGYLIFYYNRTNKQIVDSAVVIIIQINNQYMH